MSHVITAACIGVNEASCVAVCPVDCIFPVGEMHLIDPQECIDCGACLPDCPVAAIYVAEDLPEELRGFRAINAAVGESAGQAREAVDRFISAGG